MADGVMRSAFLTLMLLLGANLQFVHAQGLVDPMQPPSLVLPPSGGAGGVSEAEGALRDTAVVLQSTLVSSTRRIAVINGKAMRVGDKIGEARIVAISSTSVSLLEAGKTRLIQLSPEMQSKRVDGTEAVSEKAGGVVGRSAGRTKGGDK